MLRARRVLGIALTGASIAIIASFYACSPPPIGAGLPSDYLQGNRAFNQRLNERFPVGTKAKELTRELQREGFKREPDYGAKHMAIFVLEGFPCGSQWRVIWTADAAGVLTSIDGLYSDTGCP